MAVVEEGSKRLKLIIRNEKATDVSAIEKVTIAAFKDQVYSDHTEQFIVNALRAADALTISLVAEFEDEIVGHVAVSPVIIDDGSQGWFGLGPLSVTPDYQRQGIGSKLMVNALEKLEQQAAGCVLLGEPEYYCRFGFKVASELVLPGVPAEYFQSICLNGDMAKGTVSYHSAFTAVN